MSSLLVLVTTFVLVLAVFAAELDADLTLPLSSAFLSSGDPGLCGEYSLSEENSRWLGAYLPSDEAGLSSEYVPLEDTGLLGEYVPSKDTGVLSELYVPSEDTGLFNQADFWSSDQIASLDADIESQLLSNDDIDLWDTSFEITDSSSQEDNLSLFAIKSRFRRRDAPAQCQNPISSPPLDFTNPLTDLITPPTGLDKPSWWPDWVPWPGGGGGGEKEPGVVRPDLDQLWNLDSNDNLYCSGLSKGLLPLGVCPSRIEGVKRWSGLSDGQVGSLRTWSVDDPIAGKLIEVEIPQVQFRRSTECAVD